MRSFVCLTAVAGFILVGGCVPQDRYDSLLTANRSLKEQLSAASAERQQAIAHARMLEGELSSSQGQYGGLQNRYDQLNNSMAGLDAQNEAYLRRISDLELGPLPRSVESAIQDIARRNPDVLTFDAQRGLLHFASDFTFDLGSVALKADAADTIMALANVLNDASAAGLEASVVGHTDNVPIRRAETRRQHPTNTHLSVHRAISVRDALVQAGVAPDRIQVAGYGEYRPIVANGAGGAAANRRVEILLTPMTGTMSTQQQMNPSPTVSGETTNNADMPPMK